jgi:hypothetical protein
MTSSIAEGAGLVADETGGDPGLVAVATATIVDESRPARTASRVARRPR